MKRLAYYLFAVVVISATMASVCRPRPLLPEEPLICVMVKIGSTSSLDVPPNASFDQINDGQVYGFEVWAEGKKLAWEAVFMDRKNLVHCFAFNAPAGYKKSDIGKELTITIKPAEAVGNMYCDAVFHLKNGVWVREDSLQFKVKINGNRCAETSQTSVECNVLPPMVFHAFPG